MAEAVGEMSSMKRRKLWKTGEDGLCCSSSAIQTRLGPSSLLEERSKTAIVFCFLCIVSYPPNWGKQPRYIDRQTRNFIQITYGGGSVKRSDRILWIAQTKSTAMFSR